MNNNDIISVKILDLPGAGGGCAWLVVLLGVALVAQNLVVLIGLH
jgi:hypothetical protein